MLRTLIETRVHRRLAVITITVIIAIFGAHAFMETPIEAYPDVTNTQYPGHGHQSDVRLRA